MKIGILNIGDELLAGKILNTNQFELARMLRPLGHDIVYGLVAGDNEAMLVDIFTTALGAGARGPASSNRSATPGPQLPKVDVLVLTGGLGPTHDDLTRQAVAAYLGGAVVESPQALEWLRAFIGKPGADLPPGQRGQASVPEGTEALRNPAGTACGFRFRHNGSLVFSFPGVPSELEAMAREYLLPELATDQILLEKGLWTWGWSEGNQRHALEGFQIPEDFRFSSLPGERGVRISLQCLCAPQARADRQAQLDALWNALVSVVPEENLVDVSGADLPAAVFNLLRARRATVSVAESCTGGGLGFLLTENSGSSDVFHKGYLTYSNAAKTEMLGVDADVLKVHGAVSEATALAMARGCLDRSGSDYACAITGIAGPTGGSSDKPVGTIWIAVASRQDAYARRFQLRGDRKMIRQRSCYSALNQLRLFLLGKHWSS